MMSESTDPVERQGNAQGQQTSTQRAWQQMGVALRRALELLGVRAGRPVESRFGEDEYAHLTLAITFKRCADQLMNRTDQVFPTDHYVVAARLYADSLRLAAQLSEPRPMDDPAVADGVSTQGASLAEREPQNAQTALGAPNSALAPRWAPSGVEEFAALPPAKRKSHAEELRNASASVVGSLSREVELSARTMLARPLRAGLTSAALLGLMTLVAYAWIERSNLANGKPWRASSALGECQPIHRGGCPARPGIFFHTKEDDNPWIEYDLSKPTAFSSVVVENAKDGFTERAIPLIIEVGNDQVNWREIARTTSDFKEWTATFPTITARFVRLRVPRVTYLHLAQVTIKR
jgi:hypothetical protein